MFQCSVLCISANITTPVSEKTSANIHPFAAPSETESNQAYARYRMGLKLNKVSLNLVIVVQKLLFKEQMASNKNWN